MRRIVKIREIWFYLGILLFSLLVLWPLVRPGFIVTDDGDWMVIRLSAFFQSLREGQFPVRFLGRLNYGFGYPVANFLYPGFLYLGSVIHLLGISFPDTVKVIFAGSVVASAFLGYAWLRQKFLRFASFVGSLNFIFAPYLLFDIYKRGSVGEVLAMVPATLSFYSIDSKKDWLLPLAVAFLIVSHNSLALMFLLILAAYLIVKGKTRLFLPFVLGVGLATFFWFPALVEQRYVIFNQVAVSNPFDYFVWGPEVMLLGLTGIAAASLLLIAGKKSQGVEIIFFLTVFIATILLSTSLSSVVWRSKIFADLFQFPFRFLAVGLLAGAWLIAEALTIFGEHRGKLLMLFALLWVVPLASILAAVKSVERPLGYYTTNEATTTVMDEYMPRWVADKPKSHVIPKVVFYKGRGSIEPGKPSSQHIAATIVAAEESTVQINIIYYPGWGVAVDDEAVRVTYNNPQGLMRVTVPAGRHRLVAEFRETFSRFVADLMSLASALGALIYIFYVSRGKPKL